MKKIFTLLLLFVAHLLNAQVCTPAGDQTSYGSSDTWIGYIYDNIDFTNYSGYVNEGSAGNPNFDESFGGDYVNYSTNGCPVLTESFSARYKLTKTFAPGDYQFVVGADDGYRLSIDGGSTWIVDHFNDQAYTFSAYNVTLNGTYNLVLEYYENGGGNRVSFSVAAVCNPVDDPSIYGTNDVWRGYIYQGTNFNTYSGFATEGTSGNPNFDESFGGGNTLYTTSSCQVTTENFSARYRLQKTFAANNYSITVGGDDGYRLSLDGGSTWVINQWQDQAYNTTTYNAALSGTYNIVLEYYESGGSNEVSFTATVNSLLPVQLLGFNGQAAGKAINLNWKVGQEINTAYYQLERSENGVDFTALAKINAAALADNGTGKTYGYTDTAPFSGSNYYRLRMVDKDARYTVSAVIKIVMNDKTGISIFPSVVSHTPVFLKPAVDLKSGTVDVYDLNGRQLQQIRLPALVSAGQTITLTASINVPGNYVLICKSAGNIKAKQIIIVQ